VTPLSHFARALKPFMASPLQFQPGTKIGQGALLTQDQSQVSPDKRYVSFMYSYPNFIPHDAASVHRIVSRLEPFSFTKLYGAWPNFVGARERKRGASAFGRALPANLENFHRLKSVSLKRASSRCSNVFTGALVALGDIRLKYP